jgi:16S rRNA (guanine527-N7)-methyltransferase
VKIGSSDWSKLIARGGGQFGIQVDQNQLDLLAAHATELVHWNRKKNITAITDPFEIAVKHVLDSLIPANLIPAGAALLDMGTGGGFPGLPLKIVMPSLRVTLIDASRKKINFLKYVIRALNLKNVEALHTRAEELASVANHLNGHDVVISRAFSALSQFVKLSRPFLKKTGSMIAMKAQIDQSELNSLNVLRSGEHEIARIEQDRYSLSLKKYILPYVDADRTIICLRPIL